MKRVLQVWVLSEDSFLAATHMDLIRKSGHRATLRGQVTLQEIRKETPDLLLLDLQDAEGRGLLHGMVQQRLTGRTPVIVLGTHPELEYELLDAFAILSRTGDPYRLTEQMQCLASRPALEGDYPPLKGHMAISFQDFLVEHAGLQFAQRTLRFLERGLHCRMRAVQSQDYQDYFAYLKGYYESRNELKKLVSLLTVGETSFFRYRSDSESLVRYVLPELIRRRSAERRLSIWSAGCSTGEEPYSIAILLLEHFPHLAGWDIEILATDINNRSLQKARTGIYGSHALRNTADLLLNRYFTPVAADGYQLVPRVRGMVQFAYHNLQGGEFPLGVVGKCPDLIFCRNVLIYFRRQDSFKIIQRFHRCLQPHGYLYLGHSENLTDMGDHFRVTHQQGAVFYQPQKNTNGLETAPVAPSPALPIAKKLLKPPLATNLEPLPNLSLILQAARQAKNRDESAEAARCYSKIIHHLPNHLDAIIGLARIQADMGNYAQTRKLCDRAIDLNDLNPDAYFLSGQTFDTEGRLEEAATEYRKVLWLQLDFFAANYSLARVYWRQGKMEEAVRGIRTVLRQLEKVPPDTVIPHSGGLTRSDFMRLCCEEFNLLSTPDKRRPLQEASVKAFGRREEPGSVSSSRSLW